MNNVAFPKGSFGVIAASAQGSPRGVAVPVQNRIAQPVLGGSVRPPTVSNQTAGATLGNISSPSTTSGTTVNKASSQIAATKPKAFNYTLLAVGIAVIIAAIVVIK
jgi:hypothetical protein